MGEKTRRTEEQRIKERKEGNKKQKTKERDKTKHKNLTNKLTTELSHLRWPFIHQTTQTHWLQVASSLAVSETYICWQTSTSSRRNEQKWRGEGTQRELTSFCTRLCEPVSPSCLLWLVSRSSNWGSSRCWELHQFNNWGSWLLISASVRSTNFTMNRRMESSLVGTPASSAAHSSPHPSRNVPPKLQLAF